MASEEGVRRSPHASRWASLLASLTAVLLIFETITGLSIYLLPFSLTNQFAVLLHTAVGIPFLLPLLWYLARHWLDYRQYGFNHYLATGYVSLVALLACAVSGAVLTVQAIWGTGISYAWDAVHIVSTFAVIAFTVPHIVLLVLRERNARDR